MIEAADECRQFRAFPRTEHVERGQRFLHHRHQQRLHFARQFRFERRNKHARKAQSDIQIRIGMRQVVFGSSLTESRDISAQHGFIQASGFPIQTPRNPNPNIQMAPHHSPLDGHPQCVFERVQSRRGVKVQIEPAVIQAFQSHNNLALIGGAGHPRKPGHAANQAAHGFTTGSATRNCKSCSR